MNTRNLFTLMSRIHHFRLGVCLLARVQLVRQMQRAAANHAQVVAAMDTLGHDIEAAYKAGHYQTMHGAGYLAYGRVLQARQDQIHRQQLALAERKSELDTEAHRHLRQQKALERLVQLRRGAAQMRRAKRAERQFEDMLALHARQTGSAF